MIYLPPPCFNEEEILEWDVHIMYGLLTKHKIKMAGLILAKFFFCVCFYGPWQSGGPYKHAKKEQGQYAAILTEQAWSIKNLLYGIKHQNMVNLPCGRKPIPERAW